MSSSLLVTSHSRFLILVFKLGFPISRIVIPSVAEGSFLHCGHCHIGTGRETTPWCFVFLLSHILHLSLCKEDFSLRSK